MIYWLKKGDFHSYVELGEGMNINYIEEWAFHHIEESLLDPSLRAVTFNYIE